MDYISRFQILIQDPDYVYRTWISLPFLAILLIITLFIKGKGDFMAWRMHALYHDAESEYLGANGSGGHQ